MVMGKPRPLLSVLLLSLAGLFVICTEGLNFQSGRRIIIQRPFVALAPFVVGRASARADPPLVGRFEKLNGALSFIGSWDYRASKGPEAGELRFQKDGEVELVSKSGEVLAVGAVPWRYESAKSGDTSVRLSFTLDAEGYDVLILSGTLTTEGGPGRLMEGIIETGRAEIGARGGGPRKQVGEFSARSIGF